MKRIAVTIVALTIALFVDAAENTFSVDQIIEKANDVSYYAGKDGKANVKMTISDGKSGDRVREFTILRMNTEAKNQKFYVYFKAPADVRNMAFLVWKNVGQEDDRWLWLPALNLKKRIAPGDKRTSFVGSDFFYEDVSGRAIDEDRHELISTTESQYKIKSIPKDSDAVEFSYYYVWIDKDTFLPRKAEYYDRNDKLYRVVEAIKTDIIQGYPTVVEAVAKDLKAGTSTRNTFSNVQYDIGLNKNIFTERFLRRPPREVM